MAPQILWGILWAGAGLLMAVFPPRCRLPRWATILALAFVVFSLAVFLPRSFGSSADWRVRLDSLGLHTGTLSVVQPQLAAESLAGIFATVFVGLYLFGHRVEARTLQKLALGFTLGVSLWLIAAYLSHREGETFGFFPNRNHTGTLLMMSVVTGLGVLVHSIRYKTWGMVALAALGLVLPMHRLATSLESRAPLLLLPVGLGVWFWLSGLKLRKGHAVKAVLLVLLAGGGTFLIGESKVKTRLMGDPAVSELVQNEGRLGIYQDTLRMIGSEPWTGVGAGQYAWIFPQYREATRISAETPILHPESDWLLVLVEHGWAAALALVLLVGVGFTKGGAAILRSHGRSLRAGCLVAAGILALHGLVDVPGHRVGLAWAAMLLAAACLPSQHAKEALVASSRFSRALWRLVGLGLAGAGCVLLFHGATGSPLLPSELKASHLRKAESYFNEDRAAAKAADETGVKYRPPADRDPLKKALAELDRGLAISPLEPHLHYSRGLISLHYKSGADAARRSFEIQSELEPSGVGMVLEQARSWSARDVRETEGRWKLALGRSRQDEERDPFSQASPKKIYEKMVQMSVTQAKLLEISREMAGGQVDLLVIWVRSAPQEALDSIALSITDESLSKADKKRLLEEWRARGRVVAAEAFEKSHSDLFKEN